MNGKRVSNLPEQSSATVTTAATIRATTIATTTTRKQKTESYKIIVVPFDRMSRRMQQRSAGGLMRRKVD